ncbi:SMI1/KNR4 family protein [Nocardia asteroides]|uniref:SMI1/KNR4 family protein n=1 Tax=Nocardia asteroides TaxID=1824 RepID=UPI0034190B10
MESFSRELINSGFATSDTIRGCDPDEIARVLAPAGFPVPAEYHAFLACMGKQAGTLFQGTDLFYPQMLDAWEAAGDIAGQELSLADRFFFGHRQGYKVYFFEPGSAAVHCYQEGIPGVRALADDFLAFLRRSWAVQQSIREATQAI